MAGGIDEPSCVVGDHEAYEHPPDYEGPAPQNIEQSAGEHGQGNVRAAQKSIKRYTEQVGCIATDNLPLALFGRRPEHPKDMTPPETLARVVGIPVLVRVLMVLAVVRHPLDRPALHR